MTITIYHNPQCGTSRNTLDLIRKSGTEPEIIEYLHAMPTHEKLMELTRAMGIRPRDLLREKETLFKELGLDNPQLSDDQLIDAMLQHPVLMNRPIVVTPLGVRLCRPSDSVLDILPDAQRGEFHSEAGEMIVDKNGQRVTPRA